MAISAAQALVFSADTRLIESFTTVFGELGIEAQSSGEYHSVRDRLESEKYDALVLDFDTVLAAKSVLSTLRTVLHNRNAVVFAVATGIQPREEALRDGAHFLLQRPVVPSGMRETVRAAYDLISAERRRYFRCAAELPVALTIHRSGATIRCATMNVSSNGMAVATPVPLSAAETADVSLDLPNGSVVRGTGIVIWDDRHGKSGLKFSCSGPEARRELDAWLDSKFTEPRQAQN
jgi:DNA-binding response OmpR family regulator